MLISSEPGIGKSRLAEAFRESLEYEPHTLLRYFCSPHHQDSALFPFIGQLERTAGFERDDTPSVRLEKLEAFVAANAPTEDDLRLLAELVSVPLDNRYPALDFTPQDKKQRTFEALLRQLAGFAHQRPVKAYTLGSVRRLRSTFRRLSRRSRRSSPIISPKAGWLIRRSAIGCEPAKLQPPGPLISKLSSIYGGVSRRWALCLVAH